MKPIATRIYVFINAAVALAVLLGIFVGLNWDRMPGGIGEFLAIRITVKNLVMTAVFVLSYALAFRAFGLSNPHRTDAFWKEFVQVSKACTVASIIGLLFPLTSRSGTFADRVLIYFLPIAILAALCGRIVARICADRLTRALTGRHEMIIVGSGPRAVEAYRHMHEPHHGHTHVLGFVDTLNIDTFNGGSVPAAVGKRMLGSLDDLEGILTREPVDEVLIALPAKSCYNQIQTVIHTCERVGVEAKYLSDVFELSLARPTFEPDGEASVVSLHVVQDDYRLIVKRCIDIVGAIAGLICFGPLMLAIAAAIKLTAPGPVFFAQERYGLNRRLFRMYKFRTMVAGAEQLQASLESRNEADGPVFKIRNDPRITPIGRILRKTSLDELPQFLNVLFGDMSLVGPRPLPKRDVSRFDDASLMRRFSVKPGLTCLWQLSGRSDVNFDRWIALDLKYIDCWSLTSDWFILAKTIPAVLKGRGAV